MSGGLLRQVDAIVFIVDAVDKERFMESKVHTPARSPRTPETTGERAEQVFIFVCMNARGFGFGVHRPKYRRAGDSSFLSLTM